MNIRDYLDQGLGFRPSFDTDGSSSGGDSSQTTDGETDGGGSEGSDDPSGPPERPDHIPEKFWDSEKGELRSDALLKSYGELEKTRVNPDKLKQKWEEERLAARPETPDAYELPDDDRFDQEALQSSPIVELWRNAAHNAGIDQEGFNEVLVQYAEKVGEETAAQVEAEIEALGENAQTRIDAAAAWANKNFKDDELGAIQGIATSAAGVRVLERFMKLTRESGVPDHDDPGSAVSGNDSREEIEALMATPAYYSPTNFDQKVRDRVDAFFKANKK